MSKSMEIAIVLDCSNVMGGYVHRFKKEIGDILKTTEKQRNGKLKVALVNYIRTDDDTQINNISFTDNLSKIPELIPSQHTVIVDNPLDDSTIQYEPKSFKPTNIHAALGHAINKLCWSGTTESSRRILILIGKNPPHGVKYHKLGRECDPWPDGVISPDDTDILSALGQKKIHLYMISIQQSLDLFNAVLSKTDHMESNLKYVHHINVENENELIKEIEQNVIKIKRNGKKHEEHKMSTERFEEDLLGTETKETDPDVAEGKMKWIKNEFNNKWCPLLILSTTSKTARVWNGEKVFTVTIERLKERNYDKYDAEAMPVFHKLLQSSFDRQQSYENAKQECREIQQKIGSNLRCASDADVKWLKYQNKSWHPVLIVQRSPLKSIVLDKDHQLKEVKNSALKNEPEYENSSHIASHVKRLHDICSNYKWKSPIRAQCSWKDGTNWTGLKDNIRTGVIERIQNVWKGEIRYIVRDDETNRTVQLSTANTDKFTILDTMGYKSRMTITNKRLKSIEDDNRSLKSQLEAEERNRKYWNNEANRLNRERNTLTNDINQFKKQTNSLKDDNKSLKSQLEVEERKRKYWNSEVNRLNRERNTLMNDINQFKKQTNLLKEDNDHLRSRITKNKRDIESKAKELEEVQNECSKAITMKQDSERKFKTILNNYDNLKLDAEKLRKQKEKQQQLVNKLRDKKIEDSSALDLSRGFPPIQDIVRDFGLVKSQYHVEAAKLVKKILKKKNQNYSKLRNYKIASNMLFDILMDSFEEMKTFEQEQFQKMAKGHEIDDIHQKKAVEKKMKEMHLSIINEVKKAKAQKIVNQHKELQELDGYLEDDNILLKYAEECISICWVIVLVRNPNLTIKPQVFDQSENDIEFDEKSHIEGFGSDTEYCLNFVIWPSIFREDTDYNISQMTGVFIEDIPKWNKKYMRKMKEKQKNEKKEQKKKKKNEMEEKSEDNIINGIDNETAKTNVEKENNNAPDECGDDTNDANVDADGDFDGMNDIERY